MSAESVVTYVSAGAAVLAAAAAVWQAAEARRSAKGAAANERAAGEAAERAAIAGERAAIALEESNELQREVNRKPRWMVEVTRDKGNDRIRITNHGPTAYDVSAGLLDVPPGLLRSDTFPATELGAGLSGTLSLFKVMGLHQDRVLELCWRDTPDGDMMTTSITT